VGEGAGDLLSGGGDQIIGLVRRIGHRGLPPESLADYAVRSLFVPRGGG
jgi:hypothetical protein